MEILESPSAILGVLAFAMIVIREVMAFTKEKKSASNNGIYEYERWKSMEEAIRKLTHSINNNSQLMQTVIHYTKETRSEIKEALRSCKK